jgi:NitT/TauT family transport system substrate-binding protein
MMFKRNFIIALLIINVLILSSCGIKESKRRQMLLRVGYFPNITHAQAVVGMSEKFYHQELGKTVQIKTFLFNAGPSAMEALLAGQLDLVYVGPNPAINCYIKSHGKALRIVAGCCSGGAALVSHGDVKLKDPLDLRGKRIATPQLGNTQDVALRTYLSSHNMKPIEHGGDVQILPTANNNMLLLFQRREIHAVWTVEPWVSRLVVEGGGKVFLDERELWENGQFTTALLVASTRFIDENTELVQKFIDLHVEMTFRINSDPKWAKNVINKELERITGRPLPKELFDQAWNRLEFTYDPLRRSLFKSADQAYQLGFLGDKRPNLKDIFDLRFLRESLRRRGKNGVGL